MNIRFVKESDALDLLKIYAPYVENTAISFEYEVPSVIEFKNRIKTISSKYPYLVAIIDNKIVGYAYAHTFINRKAYDYSVELTIYLDKDYKHNHLGSKLYEALENILKEMNICNMNSCIAYTNNTDEYLDNASYYFHKALGFNLVGTFHNSGYKFNKWYDMIWMEKLIGEFETSQPKILYINEIKEIVKTKYGIK